MSNPFHKAISWYFTKRALPYWSILAIDCLIVLSSMLSTYVIENGGGEHIEYHISIVRNLFNIPFVFYDWFPDVPYVFRGNSLLLVQGFAPSGFRLLHRARTLGHLSKHTSPL